MEMFKPLASKPVDRSHEEIRFLVSGIVPLKCDKKPYSDFGRHFSMEERMR